jgi:hypothetical protein
MTDYSGAKNETVIAIVGTDRNSRGVRDIATDGDELEASYAEWVGAAKVALIRAATSTQPLCDRVAATWASNWR